MTKPVAVLISDQHYTVGTLQLADTAFRMAINKAAELEIPLIDCGDVTNDKAIMRAEVTNALINTCIYAKVKKVQVSFIVGNHSLINEKSSQHALEFLKPYSNVVDHPEYLSGFLCIPYQASVEDFRGAMDLAQPGQIVIIHQGVLGGNAGHYIQDHSAITLDDLRGHKSAGGHWHPHHTVGTHTFVGNTYTNNFGEAGDHPKGFCILYSDGSTKHVPTNLRKHVKIERRVDETVEPLLDLNPGDLVWLKITGPRLKLDRLSKQNLAITFGIPGDFKLDLVPTDTQQLRISPDKPQTEYEMLDELIDASDETDTEKLTLKNLYRETLK